MVNLNNGKLDILIDQVNNIDFSCGNLCKEITTGYDKEKKEWEVIVKYNGNIENIKEDLDATVEILTNSCAIVTLPYKNIKKLVNYDTIEYIEKPCISRLEINNSMTKSCIRSVQKDNTLNLNGEGVIVAILDSGIDYSHADFIKNDGTSRILYIWDQSINGKPPKGFERGWEYTNEDINKALKIENIEERKKVVPSTDYLGHGTAVAGVACGNGREENGKYIGAAPNSSIIVVKIGEDIDKGFARNTELMRAIKYVIDKAEELRMPICINISFGSNNGSHDGTSIFENYIDDISKRWKTNIIIASGNEGDAKNHFRSVLKESIPLEVEFSIGEGINTLWMSLWKSFLDLFSFELISPDCISTGIIYYSSDLRKFNFINSMAYVIFGQPTQYNEDQEVYFQINSNEKSFLIPGIWTLKIRPEYIINGEINIWLPSRETIGSETYFLKSDKNITLTVPSTSLNSITVGGYDSQINSIASFSGRGYTRKYNIVKPDIVAPSVSILSCKVDGGYDTFTGTSFAAPHVTGSAALLMQWGIVKENDIFLYGQKLKVYLQLGATRFNNKNYPNCDWGYGIICVANSINYLRLYDISNSKCNLSENINNIDTLNLKNLYNKDNNNDKKISSIFSESNDTSDLYNSLDDKLSHVYTKSEKILSNDYYDFIINFSSIVEEYINENKDSTYINLLYENFALLGIHKDKLQDFLSNEGRYIIQETPKLLTTTGRQDLESAGILSVQNQPYLNLTGYGTIVAIIDTGVDYTNDSFINEDNTTKILYIWDQTIESDNNPELYNYGTEYTKDDIDKALNLKNPRDLVKHKDTNGHGTFLASISCGKENYKNDFLGVAYDADLIVVKLKKAKKYLIEDNIISEDIEEVYQSTDILAAIDYVINKARCIGKPISICLGLATNDGAHDGSSLFEEYISRIALANGVIIVTSVGNEGKRNNHMKGIIQRRGEYKDIEFKVGQNEKGFVMVIYADQSDKLSLSIVSPTGEKIDRIPVRNNSKVSIKLVLERTKIIVEYRLTNTRSASEEIIIRFLDPTPGNWVATVHGDFILNGTFHAWLPVDKFIKEDTIFLEADPNYTATIPSTAEGVISVGAYNSNDNTLYVSSGRGPNRFDKIRPNFVAPGVKVLGVFPNEEASMTGTSVSAAITAGACALLLQWGFVEGNETILNSIKALSYLIKGCNRKDNLSYPNYQWGYGTLNLYKSFEMLRPGPML